jgi:DNA polymerase IV
MTWTQVKMHSLPHAILHIDADAFFASCEQALHPEYKGKPVVTGKERGIVSAASYEAKAKGISRGVPLRDVKKICPEAIIVASDYETYGLFSKRLFAIMKRFSNIVEEYGIDEGFIDITGLRKPLGMSYQDIARTMKATIEQELGITVSVGLAATKSLAKIASKMNKPSGFTYIPNRKAAEMLSVMPIDNVWGVGPNTAAYMRQMGIETVSAFMNMPWEIVQQNFTKPHQQIWHELNGFKVYKVIKEEKQRYMSISKTRTFTPASKKKNIVLGQLLKNLENACIKARRHGLLARKMTVFLKTQDFGVQALDVCLTRASAYPNDMTPLVKDIFAQLFEKGVMYRATGVVLADLQEDMCVQADMFESPVALMKMQRVYEAVDKVAKQFGKHALHLAGALPAHASQHSGSRGNIAYRKRHLLPGETKRRRLAVPVLAGGVK